MIAVLQRVTSAAVRVEEETVGEIGKGLLILLGVAEGDAEEDAARLAAKIARLTDKALAGDMPASRLFASLPASVARDVRQETERERAVSSADREPAE